MDDSEILKKLEEDNELRYKMYQESWSNDVTLVKYYEAIDSVETIENFNIPFTKATYATYDRHHIMIKPYVLNTRDKFEINFKILFPTVSKLLTLTKQKQNIFVAGGSILSCLTTDITIEKYDADIFIYGLNEKDAKIKLINIAYSIVELSKCRRESVKVWRSKNAITIILHESLQAEETIQLIFCTGTSKEEILRNFDIACGSVGYDGNDIWATPYAMFCIKNRIEICHSSRSNAEYMKRLKKYNLRKRITILFPEISRTSLIFKDLLTDGSNQLDDSIWTYVSKAIKITKEDQGNNLIDIELTEYEHDGANALLVSNVDKTAFNLVRLCCNDRHKFIVHCTFEQFPEVLYKPLLNVSPKLCNEHHKKFVSSKLPYELIKFVEITDQYNIYKKLIDRLNVWEWNRMTNNIKIKPDLAKVSKVIYGIVETIYPEELEGPEA